mgnify:CR=1 FL=1
MIAWSDPPPCGCRGGRPACPRGRGLWALVQAAYAGWEGRGSEAARQNWRAQYRRWANHVWPEVCGIHATGGEVRANTNYLENADRASSQTDGQISDNAAHDRVCIRQRHAPGDPSGAFVTRAPDDGGSGARVRDHAAEREQDASRDGAGRLRHGGQADRAARLGGAPDTQGERDGLVTARLNYRCGTPALLTKPKPFAILSSVVTLTDLASAVSYHPRPLPQESDS